MKRFIGMASLALLLAMSAGVARAADAGDKPEKTGKPGKLDRAERKASVVGKVQKVEGGKVTVLTRGKNGGELTLATDSATKIRVNGQDGTLDQIKPGMRVVAKPTTGTVQSIDATGRKNGAGKKKGQKAERANAQ